MNPPRLSHLPLLALSGFLCAASCAPAQNDAGNAAKPNRKNQNVNKPKNATGNKANANKGNNANGGNKANANLGDATAFAQVGDADKKRRAVPPADAPQDIALAATNYAVPAGAILVAPDGRAEAAGTRAAPRALREAIKSAPEGATIVLRGGVYRDGDLVIPRQMTLQAAPGEAPWIDGSDVVTGWAKDGAGAWRHNGWEIAFKPTISEKNIDPKFPLANNRDMVWINGRYQTQVATRAEVGPSRFFVDYDGKALYIGDDPTGQSVEATTRFNGIVFRTKDADVLPGTMVRGLGFRRFAETGAEIQAPQITLENSSFVWNGTQGVQVRNQGQQSTSPADVVLRGANSSCHGQAGVRTWMAPRLRVENSVFSHNNVEGYRIAWGAAGIKLMKFEGLVFRNNLVADNYSFGLWLDEDANGATIVGNEFRGNQVAGLMFEISHRANIAFNVLRDNNVGLMVSNSTQGAVWNNTFADNKVGAEVKQGRRPNHQTPEEGDFFVTREISFGNNLFAAAKPDAVLLNASSGSADAAQMITSSDFNIYAPLAPLSLAKWKAAGKAENLNGLPQLRALAGVERNSVEIKTDPFVNAAKGDYRLKPGALPAQANALPATLARAEGVPAQRAYSGALAPASG